jgi:hypothetical protein
MYRIPVTTATAFHGIFTALVVVDHLLAMINGHVFLPGLLLKRFGHRIPGLLMNDGELLPAVVVEERNH